MSRAASASFWSKARTNQGCADILHHVFRRHEFALIEHRLDRRVHVDHFAERRALAAHNHGFFPGKGSMAGRIVFVLQESGHLIGYAGRTPLPVSDANPKWLFGKGLRKTFLYALERCDPAKPIILCESLWGPLGSTSAAGKQLPSWDRK